ncbi:transient receptor potential cation channel subfamily A member 1 homolog isoform X2 [Mizuhopecten yessoensis]|uniref:transient receptor potential cation channel subfamily A member 1 homolog isoform X2 n=1 Tax=Mizuhopecten yessoensis TaxID=6573 RepID=UPI000B45BD19|nr:transient receptor potential cation channel subfamily A member 1 homolog isoform X2 [Mizuhopecten yessoensis]
MSFLRDLKEEIKDVKRDQEFVLRCRITEDQYQMLEAIKTRDNNKFKHLMTRGVDPNFFNDTGSTPLHIVSGLKQTSAVKDILQVLVYFGTSLDSVDRFGQTPLHIACHTSASTVQVLLETGAAVDVQDNAGHTPLMETCSSDCPEALSIVQYLLDHNCNISLRDQEGHTALHCICGNLKQDMTLRNEIALQLLYRGLSANVEDKTGKMAMCYELNHFLHRKKPLSDKGLQLVQTLIKAGSTFNRKNRQHDRYVRYACKVSSGPMFTQLAELLAPVLSVGGVLALRDCVPKEDEDHTHFHQYLSSLACRVQPLKLMCRTALREAPELRGKLYTKVNLLPIPSTLKDYMVLVE